jgi:uncharacterized protein
VTPAQAIGLSAAAVAAGMLNSMAGGGTLVTFPALLGVGFSPLAANGTNTVALVPGSAAATWGYARELAGRRRDVLLLALPSLAGGAFGAWLVRRAGNELFGHLVPWLILGATLLFLLQEPLSRRFALREGAPSGTSRLAAIAGFQLLVATYGGFFGAGMGILILAALGQLGWTDIHEMNALKNIVAVCINSTAAVTFTVLGLVDWPVAGMMAIGAVAGGYGGARLAQRLGHKAVRRIVLFVGFGIAAWMFILELRS